MSETLTLEIPDELARRARALAAATHRRFEDAVVDWLRRAVDEPEVGALSDEALLALCDLMLDPDEQDELSALLAQHREEPLSDPERRRLDALMDSYRSGMVLKARAWKEAVARGLRPSPTDDGS